MSIDVECTACGKTGRVPDGYAGRRIQCPGCQNVITVPVASGCAIEESAAPTTPPPLPSAESAAQRLKRTWQRTTILQRAAIVLSFLVAIALFYALLPTNPSSVVGVWQYGDSQEIINFTAANWSPPRSVAQAGRYSSVKLPYRLERNILQLEDPSGSLGVYRLQFLTDDLIECERAGSSGIGLSRHFILRRVNDPEKTASRCPNCSGPSELFGGLLVCKQDKCAAVFDLMVMNGRLLVASTVRKPRPGSAPPQTESKDNLKMLGLAAHNYHDTHGHFPPATHPNAALNPQERMSWLAELLPYLDQAMLYNRMDFGTAWDAEANATWVKQHVPVLQNPGVKEAQPGEFGRTHYVGLTGLGEDAATLPVTSKRAGVFGYDRVTRLRDTTDGHSNTVMVSEASKNFGPWAAGGPSTIRALTAKPYINGPDGIGGPFPGGCNILWADGGVRFVSDKIDPNVLEALTTICGGEPVGEF